MALTTTRPPTTIAETYSKNIARERNNGRCQLTGRYDPGATDFSHRIARGRMGRWSPSNGLYVAHSLHMALDNAFHIAHAAGWFIRTETAGDYTDPATIPALCICDDQAGWWWLDPHGDGQVSRADAAEVAAAGLDPALTLPAALTELTRVTGWNA
jgi:hypothetical protein